jgi:Glycosyl transferase family 64 domain
MQRLRERALGDDDGYEIPTAQAWRRSTPSAPSSIGSNASSPLSASSGTTIGGIVIPRWCVGFIRDLRVRWYLLTPFIRRCCTMGLLPILLLLSLTGVIDLLFSRYGNKQWMDATSALSVHSSGFVVVINTYKRPSQLADAVRHYADVCGLSSGVEQVYIVWAEEGAIPPTSESFFSSSVRAQYSVNRAEVSFLFVKNSLNSRFLPIPGVADKAVFMVDDDIRVSCPSLRQGFSAWKTHPFSMVGYYPRLAAQSSRGDGTQFVYQSWPVVFWRNRMNFVLTKACFLHSRYMTMYSDPDFHPSEVLQYVDKYFNCEDVAMSLLVANATSSSDSQRPIYVEGRVSDKGLFNGISTGTGHMTRRSDCLTDLTAIYKEKGWGVPLNSAFSLRGSSWLLHAPGFWWQSRPSNIFEWFAVENIFK